ncbi:hypothetical protein STVIR_8118 [Streptomyces viridochromogenes Tue57]|uniref:Uncharacterized protein n=1 Tax=Streptomyces viridochromogenes Tue57 TaxID=1160705 RepID=L8P337_STRVR|nr:hypothetical protein STVIR_8118 [Streptomyces viridochromogenes Tue57]
MAVMACSGFVLAAVLPGVVWGLRRSFLWERVSLHPGIALPLLLLVHAWAVLGDLVRLMPTGGPLVTEPILIVAGVLFWIPVVADTRHHLSDAGRCLYLFLAAPLLDLPALGVIAAGHSAEGLTMIVAMLPIGVIAAALTWEWVNREERLAADVLAAPTAGDTHAR